MESEQPDNYFSYGHTTTDMRGRWAMFAAGRAVSNSRANAADATTTKSSRSSNATTTTASTTTSTSTTTRNRQIESTTVTASTTASSSSQEDVTEKIQKLGDLHQKGLLTDEEFAKMKMQLLSQL